MVDLHHNFFRVGIPRLVPRAWGGWVVVLLLCAALSACQAQPKTGQAAAKPEVAPTLTDTAAPAPVLKASSTAAPAATATPTQTASPVPTFTPAPPAVWLPAFLPAKLADELVFPAGVVKASSEDAAQAWVKVQTAAQEGAVAAEWVYVLAAPFPTVADDAALADVRAVWRGSPGQTLPFQGLLVSPDTRAIFEQLWGPASAAVKTVPAGEMVEKAWSEKTWWALLPFEALEPRWKVIALDGQSPIRKDFDSAAYALKVRFVLQTAPGEADRFSLAAKLANYDPGKMTTVLLTGVTALVRGTGAMMEIYGNDFPAEYIGDILREADILHINNEVPFWKTCPEPYYWKGLVFCSRTKYIQLLEDVGVDVIDLAGDHFQDWGSEAMLYTIDLYKERGWKYYGGGANIHEAQSAARFEHNGNKIAFLGCNAKPPGYAGASDTKPGAVHCDFDQLTAEIERQRADGYLPIVTFQHLEYYSYLAHPILQADFKQVADAGAVVVSGSQAHQPHAMGFDLHADGDPSFLHYGLGNLFFDQKIFGLETSQAFLDRHIFYDGRYIGTELITIMFVDDARARLMTPEEREFLLTTIFKASGW